MYTEDTIDELYHALWRELDGFRAAKIFVIICAFVPLILVAVEILKKRLDVKRFFQGAAVCVLAYAGGGGLYAFVRNISGIRVLSWCAVIFAVSCVLLAVFEKLCSGNGTLSFFLGMTAFSVIANTVVSLILIVSVLRSRDPAEPWSIYGSCFGIYQLINFCVWTADYADFIVSGTIEIIFMIFAVLAAGNLKASEKLRKFVPAVFAVSAAVCCLGSGVLFTVLDEFIRNMYGSYMAAFGLAVISALLPLLIFIFGKARGDLEVKLFLKGIAIQAAAYVCVFLLAVLVGVTSSKIVSVELVTAFDFLFIIMALLVSFALYRAVLRKCGDENKAQSFFLGASCLTLSMFLFFVIMYYEADIKPHLSYNYMDYTIEKYTEYDNTGCIRFMLVSAVTTAVAAASAFAVRRLYSSEKLAAKAEYISSAILAVLCLSVIFSEVLFT